MPVDTKAIKDELRTYPGLQGLRLSRLPRRDRHFYLLGEVPGVNVENLDTNLRRLADKFRDVHFHIPLVVRAKGKLILIRDGDSGGNKKFGS